MLFNSYIFIFLFLPAVLLGWYGLNRIKQYKMAQVFLVGMSLWFYAYFHVGYLAIILCSCGVNYLLSLYVSKYCDSLSADKLGNSSNADETCNLPEITKKACSYLKADETCNSSEITKKAGSHLKADETCNSPEITKKAGSHSGTDEKYPASRKDATQRKRTAVLWLGCILNLGILGYYKYFDFLIENVNAVANTDFNLRHILLPLGISFFTFQQLSYVVDRAKGQAPHYDLADYMTFVTFFPQLIAGPIVLHSEILPQFRDLEKRRLDRERFADGIIFFVIGLAKKVLLADLLAKPVAFAFENYSGLDSLTLFFGALAYMLELYFDFSGYCDMAVGIGKMFGMDLPVNFDSPYKSCSVREFWRRWHITLGRFFTTYVYIPMGGSRKGKLRMAINTMVVFALSGLWHGANWTFVVWGILHGLCVVWDRLKPEFMNRDRGVWKAIGCISTNIFVCLAWILFRSDSIGAAREYIKGLFSMRFFHSLGTLAETINCSELYVVRKALSLTRPGWIGPMYLYVFLAIILLSVWIVTRKNTTQIVNKFLCKNREQKKQSTAYSLWLAFMFTWSVISLSGVSTFLYFNF